MAQDGEVQVGDRIRDDISRLEGVAFGVSSFLYGCRHIGLVPDGVDKNGDPNKTHWFEEPRITVVRKVKPPEEERKKTGGPALSNLPSK